METSEQVDLIVIGAGINGAGIARDAALRGWRVALFDQADMAGGTSATSSRLIHGGLRYLEHFEFGLVRESLRERERLLANAPHLVKPQPLTLPIYAHSPRGPLMIRMGMIAYDVLSLDKSLPRHQMYSVDEAEDAEPGLATDGLRGAARYYDAQAPFPERLVVEQVVDAVAHGAVVRTWTRVTGFVLEAGVVRGVYWRHQLTGEEGVTYAPVTINVSGPWVDDVLATMTGRPKPDRLIGGTRGSHIVVEPFDGAPSDALYIEARQDGRPYFIIPWNDLYMIGTTDERFSGNPGEIRASDHEIDYLLTETNLAIPAANLERGDVLYTFAGVRPLPYAPAGKEGAITRKHIIRDHAPQIEGLLSIIGGKLTTYRSLAEEAVDAAWEKRGVPFVPSTTATSRLPGAAPDMNRAKQGIVANRPVWLSEASARWLVDRYGTRADGVIALARADETLRQQLVDGHPAIAAVVAFAIDEEFAQTLSDVLLRRTMLGLEADFGARYVEPVLDVMARLRGWTDARVDEERARFVADGQRQHALGAAVDAYVRT